MSLMTSHRIVVEVLTNVLNLLRVFISISFNLINLNVNQHIGHICKKQQHLTFVVPPSSGINLKLQGINQKQNRDLVKEKTWKLQFYVVVVLIIIINLKIYMQVKVLQKTFLFKFHSVSTSLFMNSKKTLYNIGYILK